MSLEVHLDWRGQPQLVGHLHPADQGPSVAFQYASAWLHRTDAFAIDPTSLPLQSLRIGGSLLLVPRWPLARALASAPPIRGGFLVKFSVRSQNGEELEDDYA